MPVDALCVAGSVYLYSKPTSFRLSQSEMKNPQTIFFVTVLFRACILFTVTCVSLPCVSNHLFITLFLKFDLLYFTHLMIQFLFLVVFWFFSSSFLSLLHDCMHIQVSCLSCLIPIALTFSFHTVYFWYPSCAPSGYSELMYDIRNVKVNFPCVFLDFLSMSSGLLGSSQTVFCRCWWKFIWNGRPPSSPGPLLPASEKLHQRVDVVFQNSMRMFFLTIES